MEHLWDFFSNANKAGLSLEEFLTEMANVKTKVNRTNQWKGTFRTYFKKEFSTKPKGQKQFSSFELAALVAYAMRKQGADHIFYSRLFEYVEGMLRHPFTCLVEQTNEGYTFTNKQDLDLCVLKPVVKLGQPIPASATRDSKFQETVIALIVEYLNCIRFSEHLANFANALEEVVSKYHKLAKADGLLDDSNNEENFPQSLNQFLDNVAKIKNTVDMADDWMGTFRTYFKKEFSIKPKGQKQFSSFELAALVAYAMRKQGADHIFYSRLFEYVEGMLRHPFTCLVEQTNEGYTFTNKQDLDLCVPKPVVKLGQPIPASATRDSKFQEKVIALIVEYLNCIRFSEHLADFVKALEDVVNDYNIAK